MDSGAAFRLTAQRSLTFSAEQPELIGELPVPADLACTRFRRHRVKCFDGAAGRSWTMTGTHFTFRVDIWTPANAGLARVSDRGTPALAHWCPMQGPAGPFRCILSLR